MKIGLVGVGVVGGAFANALEVHTRHEIKRYDPRLGMSDDISECEIVFVTVYFGVENQDIITKALEETTKKVSENTLIVIRSTVLPGTTDKFISQFNRPIAYMPEFLREATNVEDALYPDKLVIGAHETRQFDKVLFALGGLVKAGLVVRMKPVEAELTKLAGNMIRLCKVMVSDELAQLCEAYGAEYGPLFKAFSLDWALNPNHLDPFHGGHRGAGGRCLPKDAAMLMHAAEEKQLDLSTCQAAISLNNALLSPTDTWPKEARP